MKTPPIVLLGGVVRILDIAISIAKFEVGSYNIVTFCYDYEYYAICFGGGLIMHNAEKLTCDAIYRFILFELSDKINEAIFAKSSIEEVGHYLFDIIVQSVDGASEELIRLVIERTGAHDATYTSLNDYYKQLCCYHMHFKAIPQNVYYKVIREYVNIFRKKYPRLISEIKTSIASKNDEMRHIADQIDRITHSSNIDLRITKNIKDTEQTLFNLSQKCENLQVQKEMLIFSLDYLNECMAKFCNLDNKAEVLKTLRNIALDIATERIRDVASEFQYYYDVITISKSQTRDISRIFYMVKLVKLNEDVKQKAHSMAYQYDGLPEEIVDKLKQEQDKIPRIADLASAKSTDKQKYKVSLRHILELSGGTTGLRELLNSCVSIGNRKVFILRLLDLFDQGEFDLFNNTVPIQIEGLFSDFLKDGTVFYRFTNMQLLNKAVLRGKIQYIKNLGLDVYHEAMMYFRIYFNNLIRNKIAHGTYTYENSDDAEIFAIELFLDLEYLIFMISRKSETEKMYRILHNYKSYMAALFKKPNHYFEFLYSDLTGQRIHAEYDARDTVRPIQFAYWLLNPYYEELYGRIGDIAELQSLRQDILCNDFWKFVLNKLDEVEVSGIGRDSIDKELCSVVKCIFGCNPSAETKATLGKVNAKLSRLFAE